MDGELTQSSTQTTDHAGAHDEEKEKRWSLTHGNVVLEILATDWLVHL